MADSGDWRVADYDVARARVAHRDREQAEKGAAAEAVRLRFFCRGARSEGQVEMHVLWTCLRIILSFGESKWLYEGVEMEGAPRIWRVL